jgi:hypothetical protein
VGAIGPTLKIWSSESGAPLSDFNSYEGNISDIAPRNGVSDGAFAIVRNKDGSSALAQISLQARSISIQCYQLPGDPEKLALSKDAHTGFAAPRWGANLVTWPNFPSCSTARSVGFLGKGNAPTAIFARKNDLVIFGYSRLFDNRYARIDAFFSQRGSAIFD